MGDSKRIFSIASLVSRILRQIAHHQVVTLLALQNLGQRIAAHRGLNRVLHVGDIDLIARGLLAIHRQIQIRLADDAEQSQILDSFDRRA